MASRILTRRFSALPSRLFAETTCCSRGFATAAQKIQDFGSGDVKQKATPSAYSTPFADLFPPLGRGAPLVNLLDIVDDVFGQAPKLATQLPIRSHNRTPWDVLEDEKAFKLRVDMPGLSKEDVKVDVEDGNLIIKGQRKEGLEDDWSRGNCSYSIKIKLPDNVKVEAIKAEVKHGVLRITAPKQDETKKRVAVSVQ